MKSYTIHMLRSMPSQGTLEGRYIGQGQSPLAMSSVSQLAGLKRDFAYPEARFFCASPSVACVDTLKILYPQAEPEVILELAECDFGDWENKTAAELQGDPRFAQWLAGQASPPNGESGQVFFNRICGGFQLLVQNLISRGLTETVLAVPAGVLTSLLAAFGLPQAQPQDWLCDPGFGYSVRITPGLWARQPVMEVFAKTPFSRETGNL
ncbi:histidine phosphatase family protein [Acutalibacter sp. 1XD8-33]|uniref:histidine phosphatase family protein n=1 Tax=Acutalibacter sp. 1XD8-33 TaxID=2320081 RepID=UPI000EA29C51|nr:histidine phosphatase family protein [Acutalibacter sp. 1XD8-33]RKJ40502.1 histidine phosphatase family protein [Acutalibacter sp. 1XD8-33]